MPIDELMKEIDSKVDTMFSDYSFYDAIKNDSVNKCNEYCKSKNEEPGFTLLVNFMDENVLKTAISISMKETIKLLYSQNLLRVDD